MPKIFISHSWVDNDISRKLAEYLRRDGAEVWIDYSRIEGGDSLPEVISDAIDWCDTLVLIWSKSAIDSYWVKEEWTCAHSLRKSIVPCLIGDSKLPSILMSRLHININDFEKGYPFLARALKLITKGHNSIHKKKTTQSKPTIIRSVPTIFRSTPQELSKSDVKKMLKKYDFYSKGYSGNEEFCNPNGKGFDNDFMLQKNGQVVYDRKSGLMWQQSGSEENFFEYANQWVEKLNFAGFNDWRLPTLEEAMSLMEPEQKHGDLYIDPVFDKKQSWIWTADRVYDSSSAWIANFYDGRCSFYNFEIGICVRAVRSGQSFQE